MKNVKTGQVTYAVRDTKIDDKEIRQGDIMGIGDKGILAVGQDIQQVALQMVQEMADEDAELISIYYGSDVSEEQAEALCQQLEESYPDFDVEMLCEEIGVSRAQLYRKVKAITNLSPAEFIRNIRLECAAELLRTSQQTATEIADQIGFGSYNHFSEYFKSVYGVSPKIYKDKYKK